MSLRNKTFCSLECQANYFSANVAKWNNEECDRYFLKKSGIIVSKEWYWSTEWSNKGYELLNRNEPLDDELNDLHLTVEEYDENQEEYEIDLS